VAETEVGLGWFVAVAVGDSSVDVSSGVAVAGGSVAVGIGVLVAGGGWVGAVVMVTTTTAGTGVHVAGGAISVATTSATAVGEATAGSSSPQAARKTARIDRIVSATNTRIGFLNCTGTPPGN
jgi:hypothetical protein